MFNLHKISGVGVGTLPGIVLGCAAGDFEIGPMTILLYHISCFSAKIGKFASCDSLHPLNISTVLYSNCCSYKMC